MFLKLAWLICGLILAIILLIVFIRQCIIEKKFYKFKIILSLVFIGILAFDFAFYTQIEEMNTHVFKYIRDISGLCVIVLVGICFLICVNMSSLKTNLDQEFLKALETDKVFVLLDKKDKIKEISTSFIGLAGIDNKKEVLGMKFFDFIEKNFNLIALNDTEIKLSRLKEYFKMYASEAKEGDKAQREFLMTKKEGGSPFVLNFMDLAIFTAEKYSGHLLMGDLDSGTNLLSAQRELTDKKNELDNIKGRFQALLSITDEAVFFYDLDKKYIWGNDSLVKMLNLNGNTIGRSEFESYIHKDDLPLYNKTMSDLTQNNPNYSVKYRFKTGANYEFVHEKGKRIFSRGESDEIAGTIELISSEHYERSNMPILDSIKDEAQLLADVDSYYRNRAQFMVFMFRISNLPEINEKYGRSIGNMVLGEYVKTIKEKLINDNLLYRISGLDFVGIISDGRKMNLLKTGLERQVFTHVTMNYGNMAIDIEANFGVGYSTDDNNAKGLIKGCFNAVNTSCLPAVNTNYMFVRDIR